MGNKIIVFGKRGQLAKSLQAIRPDFTYISAKDVNPETVECGELKKLIANAELVINCFAMTDVEACELNPTKCYKANRDFVFKLVDVLPSKCKLIQISTDYTVSSNSTVYGQAKAAADNAVLSRKDRGLVVRTSALFSEYATTSFVNKLLAKLSSKEGLEVTDEQYCQPTYAHDLACFLIKHTHLSGAVNFCNSESITFLQFAREVIKAANSDKLVYAKKDSPKFAIRPEKADLPSYVPYNYTYGLYKALSLMRKK